MSDQQNEHNRRNAARRWNGGLMLRSLARIIQDSLKEWQRQKAIAELRRLDDRMLNDIGICRNDIPQIVDGLFAEPSKAAGPAELTAVKKLGRANELREVA